MDDEIPDPADALLGELSGRYTQLITQPSTLCNVNCAYCYLPDRARRRLMPVEVSAAIAHGIADQNLPAAVTVSWHGGEPLTTGHAHFEQLLLPFEQLRRERMVRHDVRTNGTLIDDRWCELFAAYGFHVGVSIDGPRELNAQRVDWKGAEIFDRVMTGIDRLKAHGLPFSVVSVVSHETIGRAGELLAFLDALGPASVGINIEERENANQERPLVSRDQATAFWRDVIAYLRGNSGLQVREITQISRYLTRKHAGEDPRPPTEPVPTVAFDGDVVVASPEFAGATAPEHDDFVVGNILRTPLNEIVRRLPEVGYVRQFAAGLVACRASCSFWEYCGGANNAANRYYEHGSLAGTETAHCRNSRQTPVAAMLELVDEDTTLADELRRLVGAPAGHQKPGVA
jgi:uncharacterized protein